MNARDIYFFYPRRRLACGTRRINVVATVRVRLCMHGDPLRINTTLVAESLRFGGLCRSSINQFATVFRTAADTGIVND